MPIFQFGDRSAVWVVMGWDKAVAPSEKAHIKIAYLNVSETFVEGPLVRGAVVFHADDLVVHASQRADNRQSIVPEVSVG